MRFFISLENCSVVRKVSFVFLTENFVFSTEMINSPASIGDTVPYLDFYYRLILKIIFTGVLRPQIATGTLSNKDGNGKVQ